MKHQCTLLAVKDLERSRQFYCSVLSMTVTADFGANITLSGTVALQTLETWESFIRKGPKDILFENNAAELYFEEDDMDGFLDRLKGMTEIEYIHPPMEHSWGQRVVRFYDPDRHIIEVGESLETVVRRFIHSGLSTEQTAQRMDIPEQFVVACLNQLP